MKKLTLVVLSVFCLFGLFTSCSLSSDILLPPPSAFTISEEEAADISASFIQNTSFSNVYDKAESLLTTYADNVVSYVKEEYPVDELLIVVDSLSEINLDSITTPPTFDDLTKESLLQAISGLSEFTEGMTYTSQLLDKYEAFLNSGDNLNWTIFIAQISNLNYIISEVASKLSTVLSDALNNVEAESGSYTLSVSDYELTVDNIEQLISTILQTALFDTSDATCDAPVSLTLKVTSNTPNSDLFKDESYQYSGSVYMTVDFNIVRNLFEDFNDYDMYIDFDTLTVSSDNLTAYIDSERHTISFSGVIATLNAFADIEGTTITIENALNENPATITINTDTGDVGTCSGKPVTNLFTINMDNGIITCDDREVPFAEVVVLTDQGKRFQFSEII